MPRFQSCETIHNFRYRFIVFIFKYADALAGLQVLLRFFVIKSPFSGP